MLKQHGKHWKKTVEIINNWLTPDSEINASEEDVKMFLQHTNSIIWIIAENDQPYNISIKKTFSNGQSNGFCAILNIEFLKNIADVILHGIFADEEFFCNLFIR